MQPRKLLVLLVALLALGGASFWFLGTANAATWRTYTGDVHPGHAYLLTVPSDAKGLDLELTGDAATAAAALYGPDHAKLGYYALDASLRSAELVAPAAGQYVLVVYALKDGALGVRVNSESAPDLVLKTAKLAREDVEIGQSDAPAKLDKAFTAKLATAPVFVTLLYEGSVQGLDAKVASEKGEVLAIAGESGSSFSPGVFGEQTGTRSSSFGNLQGATYTVTAHAASFEGTLYLTALSLPPLAPEVVAPVPAPAPVPATLVVKDPAALRLVPGQATAFAAQPGPLVLAAVDAKNASRGADATALLYAPDDSLLQVVHLTSKASTQTVNLTVAGEYVAYVLTARNVALYAQVPGGDGASRALKLANETHSFGVGVGGGDATFQLAHTPVDMLVRVGSTLDAFGSLQIRSAKGLVYAQESTASVLGFGLDDYGALNRSAFAPGEHRARLSSLGDAYVTVKTTYFLRHEPAPAPAPAPKANETTNGTATNSTNQSDPWSPIPLPWDGAGSSPIVWRPFPIEVPDTI